MSAKKIKEALTAAPLVENLDAASAISTGSTLLNLALTGHPDRGIYAGRYYWFAGSSTSGKTFITMTLLANASINPNFDQYDLFFDNVEDGALMDIREFFGPKLADRLKPPLVKDGRPLYSHDIEDFYFMLDTKLTAVEKKQAPPFILLLDSMDALSSQYDKKKFEEKKTEAAGGAKAKGDFGDGKAKINSRYIRRVVARLRDTKSILLVISQSRDNMDGGMFDPDEITSGGRALKFYATCQIWSQVGSAIKKKVNGRDRKIGVVTRMTTKKNRLSGKDWSVDVPIYYSFGVDNIGACVDFLLAEKRWRTKNGAVDAGADFDFTGSRTALIRYIEKEELEFDLRSIVVEVWREIEEACKIKRKNPYH